MLRVSSTQYQGTQWLLPSEDPTRFYRIGIQGCAAEVDPYCTETKLVLCGYLSPPPSPRAD